MEKCPGIQFVLFTFNHFQNRSKNKTAETIDELQNAFFKGLKRLTCAK
jgi:hypothetical protein